MEQEKSFKNIKGKTQVGETSTRSKTDVLNDGGLSRSSNESPVMGVEQRAEVIQTKLALSTSKGGMNVTNASKGIPITKEMVHAAYKQVKKNKGGCGVDKESIIDYEKNLPKNLYKIWNRMASGSYFPPAVLEVEIPKKDGKIRKLGIPTVGDRVAQQVIKTYLEPRLEAEFRDESYGYRPLKNAHQAVKEVQKNVRKYPWVIDMDIKSFFDKVSHELLMTALEKHVGEKWVKYYVKRWLEAPIENKEGHKYYREGMGTPQGGVVSPLLANLFLHYALDVWLEINHPNMPFVRYADDVIIHCNSQEQAEEVLAKVKERLQSCNLEVHEKKTKIVYCKTARRKASYPTVQFDFLGFSFQPRTSRTRSGKLFLGFNAAISKSNVVKITDAFKQSNFHRWTGSGIEKIGEKFNSKIRGWINYYGRINMFKLGVIFSRFHHRLINWAVNRYKRFKGSKVKAGKWIRRLAESYPHLFYHWEYPYFRNA